MNNNNEESLTYRFFYNLSYIITKSVINIFKFSWIGITKVAIKNEVLFLVYLLLIAGALFSFKFFTPDIGITIIIIALLVACISGGVWEHKYEYPTKKRRKLFNQLFEDINFYSYDKQVPYYLNEELIPPFLMILSFKSTIPLDVWKQKKELLETTINLKILDMFHKEDEYQIVNVVFQMESLPDYIPWDNEYIKDNNFLSVGMSVYGVVGIDLDKYPHTFIAGETGSGKSNILKCLIHQSILKEYEVILIDFKRGVSFSQFNEAVRIYYEYKEVIDVIKNMVEETKKRLDLFREYKVDNLTDYNMVADNNLKRIIIYIDELAELLKTRDKEVSNILYDSLETLTRLSRAVGIHLIMGIQRPDSTVVNGQIKNNVPFRICGRFTDKEPSRIMLADDRASQLPNIKGRFIVKDDVLQEIQAFCFSGNDTYDVKIEKEEIFIDTKNDIQEIEENLEQQNEELKENIIEKEEKHKPDKTINVKFDFRDLEE